MSLCENCGIKSDEIEVYDSVEPSMFLCQKCAVLTVKKLKFNFKNKGVEK